MELQPLKHQLSERNLKGVVSFFLKGLVNKARKLFVMVCGPGVCRASGRKSLEITDQSGICLLPSLESCGALTPDV